MPAQPSPEVTGAPAAPAILVVDDNEAKRIALRAMLGPLGYPVVEVDSGRAALKMLLTQTFALILMDVRMPTMNGFETAKLCRQQAKGARTPIIFVTAVGGDETESASAYASGAVDFIFTPVLPNVLRAKVSAFVDLFVQSQALQNSLESITTLNAALRDSDLRTQAVLDNVTDGIFILDEAGKIESVNRSVGHLFGYAAEEPIGRSFTSMIAPERRGQLDGPIRMRATSRDEHESLGDGPIETRGRREDGSTFPIELERSEMTHGAQTFTLASVRDISERQAHTKALEHLALHDGLTGLANRTLFGDLVTRALKVAKRSSEPHAVLVMDLDGFKQVNDSLGHDAGDVLLKQVGERLVAALREGDTVARLGGDEFGIFPADATDMQAAAALAAKIEQTCQHDFTIHGESVEVSPSIGIAMFPEHGGTTVGLLNCADLAMYTAKRSGLGHAVFDPKHETQTADHLALLGDLRHCVVRNELVLHYQPKIDLASGRIAGVEALIRWQHPRHGLLVPASFMPAVERTQLIAPLTRWVLNEALRQQRAWREEGLDLTMAVNVSSRSLRPDSGLIDDVTEMTALWETAPGRLTLELTEGALIEDAAPAVLARLHEMGERLSIDDFGTGYSSLAYLQRLPVDELKIDRSFVMNLDAVNDDAIIVRSTIDLAHNLGLTVVAEGVEGEQAAAMLLAYGCDGVQGYHFGRPSAAEDLAALLRNPIAPIARNTQGSVRRAGRRARSDTLELH
ncbi:MAG TPA: EAL domain-containing protein [Solirubrobacteraceae bacterium]|nr:EAL domain-containing protein [Solirubrobacteraceae bacterium]